MFKALFNMIIDMLATLVQTITWPINQLITATLPDLSDKILQITNTLSSVFDSITWGLGLLPVSVISTLLFILTVEIAKHTIRISSHTLIKVWCLFQRIKFW